MGWVRSAVVVLGFTLLCSCANSPLRSQPGGSVRQAILLKKGGHVAKAESILRTFLHQHPNDLPALDELGLVLQAQGRREEALLQFQRLVQLSPTDAGAYSNMGICLEALNRDDDALAAFKSAHVDIANFYRYHDNPQKAIRHLKRAIQITPSDAIAHGGLGAVLSDLGEWRKAERQYRVLLKLAPKNVHGITELGNVLLRQGRYTRAIARFKQALLLSHGTWVRAYDGLGRAFLEKHDLNQAEKYAKKAVNMRPIDTQSRDVLASIFQAEGHSKRAAEQYAVALKYDPTDEVAKQRLPALLMRNADPATAAELKEDMKTTKFPGVDMSGPYHHSDTIVGHSEAGGKDSSTVQNMLIGVLILFIGCILVLYFGFNQNEASKPGYSVISSADDEDQLLSKENYSL